MSSGRADLFARLRPLTPARIGLGRSGTGLPTRAVLAFQAAHAAARDAVSAAFHPDAVAAALGDLATVRVSSQAPDRAVYLRRPDLGRRLATLSAQPLAPGDWDLAIVVGDGLCAPAAETHAAPLVAALSARLPAWRIAPVVLASLARVAIGDEIGERLGAAMTLVLIGERPGLSAADSLGAYLTFQPRVGRVDAERNCVSNIRPPHGLSYDVAADTLAWLLTEGRRRGVTGVALKDDRPARLGAPAGSAASMSSRQPRRGGR